jgi:hypothetical protein
MYMVFMVLHVLQENEDVINVANYEIIQVLTKNIVHRMLKDNMWVGKANGITTYSKWL